MSNQSALTSGRRYMVDYFDHSTKNRLNAYRIAEYLSNAHGIKVPEDFPSRLCSAHLTSYSTPFRMSLNTVDSIVSACEIFHEYADITELVCLGLETMAQLHSCVLCKSIMLKNLINVKSSLPESFRVVVHRDGTVNVNADLTCM